MTEFDLSTLPAGPLEITLSAPGTLARYALSYTEASLPADVLAAATVSTVLVYTP